MSPELTTLTQTSLRVRSEEKPGTLGPFSRILRVVMSASGLVLTAGRPHDIYRVTLLKEYYLFIKKSLHGTVGEVVTGNAARLGRDDWTAFGTPQLLQLKQLPTYTKVIFKLILSVWSNSFAPHFSNRKHHLGDSYDVDRRAIELGYCIDHCKLSRASRARDGVTDM